MALQEKLVEWFDNIEEWYNSIDNKLDIFLEHMYNHIHGIHFGLLGLLIYILSTLTAIILYLIVDPSYSIFTHWISHLGDGPNGANIVFNSGWIISSGIMFLFLTHEIRNLRSKGAKEWSLDILSLSSLSFSGGLLLVGIFPLHLGLSHTIAALFYFIGGFSYFLTYGIIILTISCDGKIRSVFAFITVICHLLYFLSPIITVYTSIIGITIFFLEWTVLISEVSMILVMLIYYCISKVRVREMNEFREKVKSWVNNEWRHKNKLVEYVDSFYN